MANIITAPESGIYFDGNTAGVADIPTLTGDASGVAIQYDGYAGIEINSSATGVDYLDRFSVEGANGRLFGVTDEVTGTVFSVNDAAGLPIIEVESTSSHDKITIGEYGTNALVVSGDSVGIGTTDPAAKLHVDSSNSEAIRIEADNDPFVRFVENGVNRGFIQYTSTDAFIQKEASGPFHFRIGSTNKVTIADNGNVGIGTTSPASLLNVVASGNGSTALTVEDNARKIKIGRDSIQVSDLSDTYTTLYLNGGGGNVSVPVSSFTVGATGPDSGVKLQVTGHSKFKGDSYHSHINYGSSQDTYIRGGKAGSIVYINDLGTSNVGMVAGGGNVGIGTNSPDFKLDVAGDIGIDDKIYHNGDHNTYISLTSDTQTFRTGGTDRVTINNTGVGIGTTSPSGALHVQKSISGGFGGIIYNTQATGGFGLSVRGGNSSSEDALRVQNVGGTYLLNVKGDGNVGIGTTSPSEKLDVNGIASASSYFKYKGHSLNMSYGQGGSDSVLFDYTHYSDKAFLSTAADGENFNTTSSSEWVASSDHPFAGGKVLQTSGYRYFYSDYIPVTPGEELYGEIYTKYISGSGGVLYYGVERFDSEKNAILGNTGTTYFVASNVNHTSTSWTKNSSYTTLPTTHTAYNGSNGGGVYYVRMRILFNYPSGGAVRQFGGIMLKRTGVAHDQLISGEVGIGTTTLTNSSGYSTLSISGTTGGQIAFQTSGTGKHYLYSSALDFNIYNSQAGNIRLYTNASERMRINSSGEVGIGTTSPSEKLHVQGDVMIKGGGNVYTKIDHGNVGFIQFTDTSISAPNQFLIQHNYAQDNDFRIARYTGGSDFVINSSGNVGIGTTSPSHKLDIYSNENVPLRIHRPSNANLNSSGAWGIGFSTRSDAVTSTTDTRAGIFSYYNGNLFLATNNTSIVSDPDAYARLTVTAAGNVGIGTSSPAQKLEVVGQAIIDGGVGVNSSGTLHLRQKGNTAADGLAITSSHGTSHRIWKDVNGKLNIGPTSLPSSFVQDLSGNIGIGTTSPTDTLTVVGPSATGQISVTAGPTTYSTYKFKITTQAADNGLVMTMGPTPILNAYGYNDANELGLGILGHEDMLYLKSGNVGIGTTSPSDRLHIKNSDSSSENTRCDIRVENGFGYSEFGTLSGYARIQSNGTEAAAISRSASYFYTDVGVFGAHLGASDTGDGVLTINGGGASAGEAYLKLTRNNVSGFILNHAATNIQVRGTTDLPMSFWTNDSQKMTILSSGEVGIGTTSPEQKLHVANGTALLSSTSDHQRLYIRSTSSHQSIIYFGDSDNAAQGRVAYNNSNDSLYFNTNGSTKMTILSSGNVGIGTNSPSAKLEVAGSSSDGVLVSGGSNNRNTKLTAGGLVYSTTSSSGWAMSNYVVKNSDGSTLGNISGGFGSANALTYTYYGGAAYNDAAMYILSSNKNVGIGTTSPAAKLHAYNSAGGDATDKAGMLSEAVMKLQPHASNSTNMLFAQVNSGNGIGIQVTNGPATANWDIALSPFGGNVGIGITSPEVKLHIGTSTLGTSPDTNADIISSGGIIMEDNRRLSFDTDYYVHGNIRYNSINPVTEARLEIQGHYGINFITRSSSKMVISGNTGNVGIGTTSPSAPLDISSSATGGTTIELDNTSTGGRNWTLYSSGAGNSFGAGKFALYDADAASVRMLVDTSGNVGIGTTSPSQKLDVQGTILVNNEIQLVDSNMRIFRSSNDLRLRTGGGDRVTINSSGNVGIGDTSPISKLHVQDGDIKTVQASGAFDGGTFAAHAYDVNGRYAKYLFGINDTTYQRGMIYERTSGRISIINSTNTGMIGERLTVTTSGKVGIGTNNPTQYFEAFPDNNFSGVIGKVYLGYVGYADYAAFSHFDQDTTTGYALRQGSAGDTLLNAKSGQSITLRNDNYVIATVNSTGLDVNGLATASGFQTDTTNTSYNLITRNSTSTTLYVQAAQSNSTQTIASFRYGSATANAGTETLRIRRDNVNVFGANFTVGGSITGNSKNFSIPHPTKEGKRLVHSCLEGPEIGVYFRGRSTSATIEMPDYWDGLVHLDSMTVELTAVGPNQDLYVASIADDGDVTVASNTDTALNYFYVIYGERKDLERLEVEIDDTVEVEKPEEVSLPD